MNGDAFRLRWCAANSEDAEEKKTENKSHRLAVLQTAVQKSKIKEKNKKTHTYVVIHLIEFGEKPCNLSHDNSKLMCDGRRRVGGNALSGGFCSFQRALAPPSFIPILNIFCECVTLCVSDILLSTELIIQIPIWPCDVCVDFCQLCFILNFLTCMRCNRYHIMVGHSVCEREKCYCEVFAEKCQTRKKIIIRYISKMN